MTYDGDSTPLRARISPDADRADRRVVTVHGSIDHLTDPGERQELIADVLDTAGDPDTSALVLDLRHVQLMDSAGITLVVKLWRRLAADGVTLSLVATGFVRQVLVVAGIDQRIELAESPDRLLTR